MYLLLPETRDTTSSSVKTARITPSRVRNDRSLWERRASSAISAGSLKENLRFRWDVGRRGCPGGIASASESDGWREGPAAELKSLIMQTDVYDARNLCLHQPEPRHRRT